MVVSEQESEDEADNEDNEPQKDPPIKNRSRMGALNKRSTSRLKDKNDESYGLIYKQKIKIPGPSETGTKNSLETNKKYPRTESRIRN
jgi:hypothetical protein